MEDMQLVIHDFEGELARVSVETSYKTGLTLYDACYVGLAHIRGATLYTADAEVASKASSPNVKHLSEIIT